MSHEDAAGRPVTRRRKGEARMAKLLAALETLLQDEDVGAIGLYQIAREAKVPPSSVYHFFPTKEAAFLELAQMHLKEFTRLAEQGPIELPGTWQDLIESRIEEATQYYNQHLSAMKLFLGSPIIADIRHSDIEGTLALSEVRERVLNRYFNVPEIPDLRDKLATSIALADGIWTMSFAQHGFITPSSVAEGKRAVIAYLRCYLPEHIEPSAPC